MSIRWANEDPNPVAKEKEETRTVQQMAQTVSEKRMKEDPVYQYTYDTGGTQQTNVDYFPSEQHPHQYPDTTKQYGTDYSSSHKIVSDWLKQLGVEHYTDSFISAGFSDLNTLSQLDDISLDAIGVIKMDHRKKLLTLAASTAAKLAAQVQQTQAYAEQYYQYYGTMPENQNQPQYMFTNAEYSGGDDTTSQKASNSLVSGYDDLE